MYEKYRSIFELIFEYFKLFKNLIDFEFDIIRIDF